MSFLTDILEPSSDALQSLTALTPLVPYDRFVGETASNPKLYVIDFGISFLLQVAEFRSPCYKD